MGRHPVTIDMIKTVALALGELNERAVFVGGATVPFYMPEEFMNLTRPTEDVDVVMEIIGKKKFGAHEETLRKKGFQNDTSDEAPICRWVYCGLKVDIMSLDEAVMGFTNRWYKEGFGNSVSVLIPSIKIRIFSLPYFLASKIEAFKDRGKKDFIGSSDMEDIIAVLDLADTEGLENKLIKVSDELKRYLRHELHFLKSSEDFRNALPGAIFDRLNAEERSKQILARLDSILEIVR